MRIRKRPQIAANPSPRPEPLNGGDGLHHDGDLPNGRWRWRPPTLTRALNYPPPSNPYPTVPIASPLASHLNRCTIRGANLQGDEEVEADVQRTWGAKVNSNMSNIGAQVSEEKVKAKVRGDSSTSIGMTSIKNKNGNDNNMGVNGRKRRSSGILMEGSRCSRVNGRGWRCCQQTLVGYSLCEHHLGKGRLRSVSSMRGQANNREPDKCAIGAQESEKKEDPKHYSRVDNNEDDDNDDEEESEAKRRKKIGMVKARSMSSLLNESNCSIN